MIDTNRLATDPDYWRELGVPEDATHWVGPSDAPWELWSEDGSHRQAWNGRSWVSLWNPSGALHRLTVIPRPTEPVWRGEELPVGCRIDAYLSGAPVGQRNHVRGVVVFSCEDVVCIESEWSENGHTPGHIIATETHIFEYHLALTDRQRFVERASNVVSEPTPEVFGALIELYDHGARFTEDT